MGTDAGTPFNLHGANADELRYMVEVGMRPTDALTASTVNAAELMRLSDRGRLAEGFAADLLIVDGNPVEDIRAVADRSRHRMIVKNGIVAVDCRPDVVSLAEAAQ
jgi:imidazolonepropionase-like amidohydrolase